MTLHGKVVAWFAVFASVVVTLFVLGDYYQSTRALEFALEARASALARQLAVDMERRFEGAQTELREAGHEVAAGGAARITPSLQEFADVKVFEDDQLAWQTTHAPDATSGHTCVADAVPFQVEFTDASGVHYRIEANMPAATFFERVPSATGRIGNTGTTSVIDNATGALIYDDACAIRSRELPAGMEQSLASEIASHSGDPTRVWTAPVEPEKERPYLVIAARASHPAWSAVVAIDYAKWIAPFAAMRTQFLGFMLLIICAVAFLTLRMIRGEMKRLSAIARAADAIGHGRFDVWLPPPTGDEIGRLSLALGQMVNRLSSTIRQMEINAAMAAVGEMATYLTHEIRNPLSSIRLNLQMLQRDLRKGTTPSDVEQLVSLSLTEMQRLGDVVNTVLDVGRQGRGRAGVCDAHDVIDDTVKVLKSKFSAQGVSVNLRLGAVESLVAAEASKLKSCLINLLLNSVEAMHATPHKAIAITTELLELPQGTQLELRVLDSGPGVPPHLAGKVFEPFFTTKASGNGVGLATIARIVKECGGEVRCRPAREGEPGGEFILALPLAQSGEPAPQAELVAAG